MNNIELTYKSAISHRLDDIRTAMKDSRTKRATFFSNMNWILSNEIEDFSFYKTCLDQGLDPHEEAKMLIRIFFSSKLFTKIKNELEGDFDNFVEDITNRWSDAKININDPLH
jgi:hypothetical protein